MTGIMPFTRDMQIRASQMSRPIQFFTDDELTSILNHIEKRRARNRDGGSRKYMLLTKVLVYTGARINEAVRLVPADFNLTTRTVRVFTSKRKKETYRTIPIHPDLQMELMQFLLDEGIDSRSTKRKLFPMAKISAIHYYERISEEMGLKIWPHKFRHTFAVRALMAHRPLNVVQQWLGHASIFNTSIYTQILGLDTSEHMWQVPTIGQLNIKDGSVQGRK